MKTNPAVRGFTLIETLVILGIMMILAVFTLPEFFAILNRSKMEGVARQTATLMRAARLEAIKESCFGVVMIEPANERVFAFVDRDRDGLYELTNTPPDRMIGRVDLPARVYFRNETGDQDMASIKGLENEGTAVTLPEGQVMYQSDGSVLSIGALRFADDKGNILEVNVDPRTTGRVEVRKFQDNGWIANGEGGRSWKFNK